MDIYKDFLKQLRKVFFKDVYIILSDDITPKLKHYIYLLNQVKFEDGSYHTLYGEIKKIIASFMIYYNKCMDDVIKIAYKCSKVVDKEELLNIIEQTISIHYSEQTTFGKEFLPVRSPEEKEAYEEIDRTFTVFMEKVYALKEQLNKIDTQEGLEDFAKHHFEESVAKTNDLLNFTHTYLATMLADRLTEIQVSLEEIHLRLKNNLKKAQHECDCSLNELLDKLYEKNKESIRLLRNERKDSKECVEIQRAIEIIRDKIYNYDSETSLERLEEELSHWGQKLKQFYEISDNLNKLKAEMDDVVKQEGIYNSLKCIDLPGTKLLCFKEMGIKYAEKIEYLKQMIIQEAKTLITFFAVRGNNHINYEDNIGSYHVDEYKHQVYLTDNGLGINHVNCEGQFVEADTGIPYYHDINGRYIIKHNEKIYQCAPCTSEYKLTGENILKKITKDCGHSEKRNPRCKMAFKDPTKVLILPDFPPIDIKKTLETETVRYLWDTFGNILPDALYDVATIKPRNPIHLLAHSLLYHKYNRTPQEFSKKKAEAEKYRADIYQGRKEKAITASTAWKARQVKRRKPEESDDTAERQVYVAQMAALDFINSLNYYHD